MPWLLLPRFVFKYTTRTDNPRRTAQAQLCLDAALAVAKGKKKKKPATVEGRTDLSKLAQRPWFAVTLMEQPAAALPLFRLTGSDNEREI